MRLATPHAPVRILCALFGKSKQAYYQKQQRSYTQVAEQQLLLQAIQRFRQQMPRLGGRKLLVKLRAEGFHIGRDALFDLLRAEGLLVRARKRRLRTTHSFHHYKKYPNLIQSLNLEQANQLWVSDITYLKIDSGFAYLFLITDAYSRKIIGHQLADTLHAKHALAALNMAIEQRPAQATHELIHHSDRGIQYCCAPYVNRLQEHDIHISMTQSGDPLDNAIAERVNGILKTEWLDQAPLQTLAQTKQYVKHIIQIYNHQRPHSSIEMLTPQQAHFRKGPLKRLWKNYYLKMKNPYLDQPLKDL